jgi:hypothetical protein
MKCDSQASFLARTLASPCLGHKPQAKIATKGVATLKVFNIFWVLLMHGDLTCCKFFKYLVSMLMYVGRKLKVLQVL